MYKRQVFGLSLHDEVFLDPTRGETQVARGSWVRGGREIGNVSGAFTIAEDPVVPTPGTGAAEVLQGVASGGDAGTGYLVSFAIRSASSTVTALPGNLLEGFAPHRLGFTNASEDQNPTVWLAAKVGAADSTDDTLLAPDIRDKQYRVGENVNDQLEAGSGGEGELSYSLLGNIPTGLAFVQSTRRITGTPTISATATVLTYVVTDEDGISAQDTFTVTIVRSQGPLSLPAVPNYEFTEGQTVFIQLPDATGGTPPLEYALAPSIPASFGLTYDEDNRTITGVAQGTGSGRFIYSVQDSTSGTQRTGGPAVQRSFSLRVNRSLFFGYPQVLDRDYGVGTPVNDPLPRAYGVRGTVAYTVSPTLRNGLTFTTVNGMPTITGTPLAATSQTVTITATHTLAAGIQHLGPARVSRTFTIRGVSSDAPSLPSIPAQNVYVGHDVETAVVGKFLPNPLPEAVGGTGTLTYSIQGSIPFGLSFDANTRKFTGRPRLSAFRDAKNQGQGWQLAYVVTDSEGVSDRETIRIKVNRINSLHWTIPPLSRRLIVRDGAGIFDRFTLCEAVDGSGNLAEGYLVSPSSAGIPGLLIDQATARVTGAIGGGARDYPYQVFAYAKLTNGVFSGSRIRDDNVAAGGIAGQKILAVTFSAEAVQLPQPAPLSFTVNEQVSVTLPAASGGAGDYRYSLSSPLPRGLSWDGSRVISGTPLEVTASSTYTYSARDAAGSLSQVRSFTIEVVASGGDAGDLTPPTFNDPYNFIVGDTGQFLIADPTGGTAPYTATATGLPDSISFDGARLTGNALVSDLNADGTARSYTVTYTATDSTGRTTPANTTFTVSVEPAAEATDPQLPSIPNKRWPINVELSGEILPAVAAGTGTAPYTYSTSALPAGVLFNATTRELTGTPNSAGTTTVVYQATDDNGRRDSEQFTIEVETARSTTLRLPTLQNLEAVVGTEGFRLAGSDSGYTEHELPEAVGGVGNLTYALVLQGTSALESWMSFTASTRTFNGTPTTVRSYTLLYTVTDSATPTPNTDSGTFIVDVEEGETTVGELTLPNPGTIKFIAGTARNVFLPPASGGVVPHHYALGGTALPTGITFRNGDRRLRADATAVVGTTKDVQYRVRDSSTARTLVTQNFDIEVEAETTELSLPPLGIIQGTQGVAIANTVLPEATGGTSPYEYTLTNLPTGLSFDGNTRTVSGTPAAAGTTTATYTVTDSGSPQGTATASLTITIAPVETLRLPRVPLLEFSVGVAKTIALPQASGGVTPYTYTVRWGTAEPPGLSANVVARPPTVGGTATEENNWNGTYTVTDARGTSASQSFSVAATFPDTAPVLPTIPAIVLTRLTRVNRVLPQATGGNAPLTYTLATPIVPGLEFNASTRTLSGIPLNAKAAANYAYTVTDDDGDTDTEQVSIQVVANPISLTQANVTMQRDTAYSATLGAATGGTSPYSYSLVRTLPTGITFRASDRRLFGTPSNLGVFPVEYTATDNTGRIVIVQFTITVTGGEFDFPSDSFDVMLRINYQESKTLPEATGGTGNKTYSLAPNANNEWPSNSVFVAASRQIKARTQGYEQTNNMTLSVNDSSTPNARTRELAVVVRENLQPLSFVTPLSGIVVDAGHPFTLDLPAVFGGTTPLVYLIETRPFIGFDSVYRTRRYSTLRAAIADVGYVLVPALASETDSTEGLLFITGHGETGTTSSVFDAVPEPVTFGLTRTTRTSFARIGYSGFYPIRYEGVMAPFVQPSGGIESVLNFIGTYGLGSGGRSGPVTVNFIGAGRTGLTTAQGGFFVGGGQNRQLYTVTGRGGGDGVNVRGDVYTETYKQWADLRDSGADVSDSPQVGFGFAHYDGVDFGPFGGSLVGPRASRTPVGKGAATPAAGIVSPTSAWAHAPFSYLVIGTTGSEGNQQAIRLSGQANIQMRRDRKVYFDPLPAGETSVIAAYVRGPQTGGMERQTSLPIPMGVGPATPTRATFTGLPNNGGVTFDGSDPTQPKLTVAATINAPEGDYPCVYKAFGMNDSEATMNVILRIQ